jgi:hypothetical protein
MSLILLIALIRQAVPETNPPGRGNDFGFEVLVEEWVRDAQRVNRLEAVLEPRQARLVRTMV